MTTTPPEPSPGDRIADLERENAHLRHTAAVQAHRATVAAETGIPADALRGDTLDDIRAHAGVIQTAMEDARLAAIPAPQPVPSIGDQPARFGAMSAREQILAAENIGDHERAGLLKAAALATNRQHD